MTWLFQTDNFNIFTINVGDFQLFHKTVISKCSPTMVDSLQYPVATEVTSNLLSLAWRLRLHPIVGSNDPKPDPKQVNGLLSIPNVPYPHASALHSTD